MKIKINITAVYEIPDEFQFGKSEGRATISHKDNPSVKYEPNAFINFEHVEPDKDDIKENMPGHLQIKIDEGFHEASWDMETVDDND